MRVAVFGAGYAGLTIARRLEEDLPEDVELVVVDESEYHLVQHELHRVVRRPDLAETITVPLEQVLERATVRRARVVEIDPDRRTAVIEPVEERGVGAEGATSGDRTTTGEGATSSDEETETLTYDVGAICLGAETAFHDLPGVQEHAFPLKRLEDARAIRAAARDAVGGTAIVGGAGLSGVQVAGELTALSREEGLDLEVTLLEQLDRVAPAFDPTFSSAIRAELEARDVTIETGVRVDAADEAAVTLEDGRDLRYDVLVWTGGIRGPAALDGQRLPTTGDLLVGPSTYVVGDAGEVVDDWGEVAPASAQTATRQAHVAAENVLAEVAESTASGGDGNIEAWDAPKDDDDGGPREDDRAPRDEERPPGDEDRPRRDEDRPPFAYRYEPVGWTVSVGDGAVAMIGPVVLSGEPARAAKSVIGAGHLGSIGAVERSSELVAAELGWPTDERAARILGLSGRGFAEAFEYSAAIAPAAVALADTFLPGDAVDLTMYTQPADRDYPGSPANRLGRLLDDSLDAVHCTVGSGGRDAGGGPDDAGVRIEIVDDEGDTVEIADAEAGPDTDDGGESTEADDGGEPTDADDGGEPTDAGDAGESAEADDTGESTEAEAAGTRKQDEGLDGGQREGDGDGDDPAGDDGYGDEDVDDGAGAGRGGDSTADR